MNGWLCRKEGASCTNQVTSVGCVTARIMGWNDDKGREGGRMINGGTGCILLDCQSTEIATAGFTTNFDSVDNDMINQARLVPLDLSCLMGIINSAL